MSPEPKPASGEELPHPPIPTVAQAEADASGEWTVEEGITVVGNGWRVQCMHPTGAQAIATAHNAALDAAQQRIEAKHQELIDADRERQHLDDLYSRAMKQLADEKDKVIGTQAALKVAIRQANDCGEDRQTLVNALDQIGTQTVEPRCAEVANAALAKLKP